MNLTLKSAAVILGLILGASSAGIAQGASSAPVAYFAPAPAEKATPKLSPYTMRVKGAFTIKVFGQVRLEEGAGSEIMLSTPEGFVGKLHLGEMYTYGSYIEYKGVRYILRDSKKLSSYSKVGLTVKIVTLPKTPECQTGVYGDYETASYRNCFIAYID